MARDLRPFRELQNCRQRPPGHVRARRDPHWAALLPVRCICDACKWRKAQRPWPARPSAQRRADPETASAATRVWGRLSFAPSVMRLLPHWRGASARCRPLRKSRSGITGSTWINAFRARYDSRRACCPPRRCASDAPRRPASGYSRHHGGSGATPGKFLQFCARRTGRRRTGRPRTGRPRTGRPAPVLLAEQTAQPLHFFFRGPARRVAAWDGNGSFPRAAGRLPPCLPHPSRTTKETVR